MGYHCGAMIVSLYRHCMDGRVEKKVVGGPELRCGLRHMGRNGVADEW